MLTSRFITHLRTTPIPATKSLHKIAAMSTASSKRAELDKCSIGELYKNGTLKKSDADQSKTPDPVPAFQKIIHLYKGDITKLPVDAIVNAANTWLLGGAGVDGAIHTAAGPALKEECKGLKGCDTGDAKISDSHLLKKKAGIKKIIHAVGPVYTKKMGNKNAELLASCYWKSMELALKYKCRSIAFPCISCGVYDYPHDEAADIALDTVEEFLLADKMTENFDKVVFCTFMDKDYIQYKKKIP